MVRIETRPLCTEEEHQLVEEAGAGLSRGEAGCLLAVGLGAMPALGWMIGDNIAEWLGIDRRVALLSGAVVGLAAGLAWASWPSVLAGRAGRLLRDARRRLLAAGAVERWSFEPARAWNVECPQTRALLFELSDARLVLLATRHFEDLPAGSYPPRIEMEVLPQLDRVLSLSMAGEPRLTEAARFTLEELGNDEPVKKRRFVEIAAQGLDPATRGRLGLSERAGEDSAPPEPRRLPLDRVIRTLDEPERLRQLAPPVARGTAALLIWIVPALAFVAALARASFGVPWPAGGAAASLTLVLVVVWFRGVLLADAVKRRSVLRVLSRGRRPLVHVSGRVCASQTFRAPLSGRPTVFARADLLLGPHGLVQAVGFAVQCRDGSTLQVDVREACLLREGGGRRVVRVETSRAERLLGATAGAEWYRKRRLQFPTEDVVQDGDVVELLGWLEGNGTIRGTPDRPLLAWTGDAASAACSVP